MPATIECLSDQSIILITIEGRYTIEDARDIWAQTNDLIDTLEGDVYRIVDVCKMEISFGDMLAITQEIIKGQPGTAVDPRIQTIYIGHNPMNRIIRDKIYFETQAMVHIPTFCTLNEALEYIRRNRVTS
ncbi:MAG: hypothetical protein D6737_18195 [Chloroflexi bacterium]|nr:MAG: hypothetical protein D6737_18195 [Chloroflexota bacterium]